MSTFNHQICLILQTILLLASLVQQCKSAPSDDRSSSEVGTNFSKWTRYFYRDRIGRLSSDNQSYVVSPAVDSANSNEQFVNNGESRPDNNNEFKLKSDSTLSGDKADFRPVQFSSSLSSFEDKKQFKNQRFYYRFNTEPKSRADIRSKIDEPPLKKEWNHISETVDNVAQFEEPIKPKIDGNFDSNDDDENTAKAVQVIQPGGAEDRNYDETSNFEEGSSTRSDDEMLSENLNSVSSDDKANEERKKENVNSDLKNNIIESHMVVGDMRDKPKESGIDSMALKQPLENQSNPADEIKYNDDNNDGKRKSNLIDIVVPVTDRSNSKRDSTVVSLEQVIGNPIINNDISNDDKPASRLDTNPAINDDLESNNLTTNHDHYREIERQKQPDDFSSSSSQIQGGLTDKPEVDRNNNRTDNVKAARIQTDGKLLNTNSKSPNGGDRSDILYAEEENKPSSNGNLAPIIDGSHDFQSNTRDSESPKKLLPEVNRKTSGTGNLEERTITNDNNSDSKPNYVNQQQERSRSNVIATNTTSDQKKSFQEIRRESAAAGIPKKKDTTEDYDEEKVPSSSDDVRQSFGTRSPVKVNNGRNPGIRPNYANRIKRSSITNPTSRNRSGTTTNGLGSNVNNSAKRVNSNIRTTDAGRTASPSINDDDDNGLGFFGQLIKAGTKAVSAGLNLASDLTTGATDAASDGLNLANDVVTGAARGIANVLSSPSSSDTSDDNGKLEKPLSVINRGKIDSNRLIRRPPVFRHSYSGRYGR